MSMGMQQKPGLEHTTWTWTYSRNMGMHYGHEARTWACNMDMGMQHRHAQGHALWTWTCCWMAIVALYCCFLLFTELLLLLLTSFQREGRRSPWPSPPSLSREVSASWCFYFEDDAVRKVVCSFRKQQ
jgi:hypothetical protein